MKDTKIELRVTGDQKTAIALAAKADGRDMTGFILHATMTLIARKEAASKAPTFEEVRDRDKRTEYERRHKDLTPFENVWYRGGSLEEALAAAAEARKK